jgi:hypothetical protein
VVPRPRPPGAPKVRGRTIKQTDRATANVVSGGPGLSRTDTSLSEQRILSPVRLPVPPRGLVRDLAQSEGKNTADCSDSPHPAWDSVSMRAARPQKIAICGN